MLNSRVMAFAASACCVRSNPRAGGMIGRVEFPPRTRLVGFGNATLYTVRLDDDDLQYLKQWTLPYGTRLWGDRR